MIALKNLYFLITLILFDFSSRIITSVGIRGWLAEWFSHSALEHQSGLPAVQILVKAKVESV